MISIQDVTIPRLYMMIMVQLPIELQYFRQLQAGLRLEISVKLYLGR